MINSPVRILSLTILIISIFTTLLAALGTVAAAYNVWDTGLPRFDKAVYIMLGGGVVCVAEAALSSWLLIREKYLFSSLVSILVILTAVVSLSSGFSR